MDPKAAALLATTLTFVVCVIAALWYLAPWLRRQPRAAALTALLWIHAFRHIALQIFSAQKAGLTVPDDLRDQIAYGDVTGMVLAVLALVALRARARIAIPLVWLFVLATTLDLSNALVRGMSADLLGNAHGVAWLILAFYVPVLWTTLALIVWQLVTRRTETLQPAV